MFYHMKPMLGDMFFHMKPMLCDMTDVRMCVTDMSVCVSDDPRKNGEKNGMKDGGKSRMKNGREEWNEGWSEEWKGRMEGSMERRPAFIVSSQIEKIRYQCFDLPSLSSDSWDLRVTLKPQAPASRRAQVGKVCKNTFVHLCKNYIVNMITVC